MTKPEMEVMKRVLKRLESMKSNYLLREAESDNVINRNVFGIAADVLDGAIDIIKEEIGRKP